jgi:hypothetical protein
MQLTSDMSVLQYSMVKFECAFQAETDGRCSNSEALASLHKVLLGTKLQPGTSTPGSLLESGQLEECLYTCGPTFP